MHMIFVCLFLCRLRTQSLISVKRFALDTGTCRAGQKTALRAEARKAWNSKAETEGWETVQPMAKGWGYRCCGIEVSVNTGKC